MPNGIGPAQLLEPIVQAESAVMGAFAAPFLSIGITVPTLQGPASMFQGLLSNLPIGQQALTQSPTPTRSAPTVGPVTNI